MSSARFRDDLPSAHFRVTDKRGRKSSKVHVVRLGEQIKVRPDFLAEYCFRQPDSLSHDLMTLIGAVKYADRALLRQHSKGWGRQLHIELPVFKLNVWLLPEVQSSLVHCLNYLTGDSWSFSFMQRAGTPASLPQPPLREISLGNREAIFVPFSHGLDSFAQVRLLQMAQPATEVVCVYADARASGTVSKSVLKRRGVGGIQHVPVPVSVKTRRHPESSFRSRPFMFYLLAGYGALESGTNRVMIPENGQGSIGGSLVTTGHEPKHRSCYPGFTAKLSNFVEALTGRRIEFYHPALFETKGAVLRSLADAGEDVRVALQRHWSCSCDARTASRDGKMFHCGVCGNCLLRRSAEHAAGVDGATQYLFEDLTAEALESALRPGEGSVKLRFFSDLARNSARDMQRLADLALAPGHKAAQSTAVDLARFIDAGLDQTKSNLAALLERHASEWLNFMSNCGEGSWISRIARG